MEYKALSYRPDVDVAAPVTLDISADTTAYDLFEAAGRPTLPVRVAVNVAAGVLVGASSPGGSAIVARGFHPESEIVVNITATARVAGGGGNGAGARPGAFLPAEAGGAGLAVGLGIFTVRGGGILAGGGGGGGAETRDGVVAGGGGAGSPGGTGGQSFSPGAITLPDGRDGTLTDGGIGGTGISGGGVGSGRGGDPGQPGFSGTDTEGGAAGPAVGRRAGAIVSVDASVRVLGQVE